MALAFLAGIAGVALAQFSPSEKFAMPLLGGTPPPASTSTCQTQINVDDSDQFIAQDPNYLVLTLPGC